MRTSYQLARDLLRDRWTTQAPEKLRAFDGLRADDVVVVNGEHDHIQIVFDHMGVPYRFVEPHALSAPLLAGARMVFVNCGSSFPVESATLLRDWVAAGGILFTTDWALKHVVERAFPGYVEHNGKQTEGTRTCVPVQVECPDDPLVRVFAQQEAEPVWWLENASYPIQVRHDAVQVLLRSAELHDQYKNGSVLVRFPYGRGLVVHMISHLYLQHADARTALQRGKSSVYARTSGATRPTVQRYETAEREDPGLDYASVQAAAVTTEMVGELLVSRARGGASADAASDAEIFRPAETRPAFARGASEPAPGGRLRAWLRHLFRPR